MVVLDIARVFSAAAAVDAGRDAAAPDREAA
jgi:hypothetical protein